MLEKILSGGIGRGVRVAVSFLLSNVVLMPLGKLMASPVLENLPALGDLGVKALETFSNPATADQISLVLSGLLTALLSGVIKSLREKGKIPSFIPL